jgi:general stress protein 26
MTTEPRRHLKDLLEGFSTAMMITRSSDHSIHARPMAIAEIDADGMLYFATSLDSGKLREIEADPKIALTLQDSSVYISILGTAHASTDRALIDRLWAAPMQIWFPKGKDDPSLVILKIDPQDAEYWDNSGTNSIGYAVSAMKAFVHGERPIAASTSQHAKVSL